MILFQSFIRKAENAGVVKAENNGNVISAPGPGTRTACYQTRKGEKENEVQNGSNVLFRFYDARGA